MDEQQLQQAVNRVKTLVIQFKAVHQTNDIALDRLEQTFINFDQKQEGLDKYMEEAQDALKLYQTRFEDFDQQVTTIIKAGAAIIKAYFEIPKTQEDIEAEKKNPEGVPLNG